MPPVDHFEKEKRATIRRLADAKNLQKLSLEWLIEVSKLRYSYNFTWLGLPIIQFPQDIIAVQEIIWKVKPDLVIETGIARGGSLLLSASILELIGSDGQVVGIDIDIRPHNREAIQKHRLTDRITMIEGSSVDSEVIARVNEMAYGKHGVLVILDSNHAHHHVRRELDAFGPLVTRDSYLIVMDTVIEDFPEGSFPDRQWDHGDNARTAVWDFLASTDRFVIDKEIESKLLVTVAPDGYLKCVRD